MPVRIICSDCGSAHVSRDAWADWSAERQEWVLGTVFDDGHCHVCERDVTLVELPVDVTSSVAT